MNKRTHSLLLLALVALLGGGFYGYRLWSEFARERGERERLFATLDGILQRADRADPELSSVVARLRKLDAHDRAVVLALARIELLRDRCEAAAELLEPLVVAGGSASELRVAARAWLGWHQSTGRDRGARTALLRQALQHAEGAAAATDAPEDHFLAWLAAVRLEDAAARRAHADALARSPDGREARTVAAIDSAENLTQPLAPIEALIAEWPRAPVELRALQAMLMLNQGRVEPAVKLVDELASEAPNLLPLRVLAATAHHMSGLLLEAGPARERQFDVRDAQIRWLDGNAEPDDPRRPTWLALRQER